MSPGSGLQGIQVAFAAGEGKLDPEQGSAPAAFLLPGAGRRAQRDVVRGLSPVARHSARGPHGRDAVAIRLQRYPRAQDAADGGPDVRGDAAARPGQGCGHAGGVPGYDRQRERALDPAPEQRPRFLQDRAGPEGPTIRLRPLFPRHVQAAARAMEYPLKQQGIRSPTFSSMRACRRSASTATPSSRPCWASSAMP
ncbi:MAG: hypothetical protein MZV63_14205 [Marinilabiliales bacterium]|nr:hypothetical protein [Marinilabiliales bacterium]